VRVRSQGLALGLGVLFFCLAANWSARAAGLGIFEQATEVGENPLKGSSEHLVDKAQYRVGGGGANLWKTTDAFHFLWKKTSGDLVFSMDVGWEDAGKHAHRKACAMVRQSLDVDSPYVDVAVHGDGLIQLQYRPQKGGLSIGVSTPVKAPATVKLERDGDVFTAFVSKDGGPFQTIGAFSLTMPDPVYVGLAVCSHNAQNLETALISNVKLESRVALQNEKRVRETSLETLVVATGERKLVYRDCSEFEAPNWSRDGKLFYINRGGFLWTLPVEGGEPKRLDTGAVVKNNNDHGLSFDGKWLAISSSTKEPGGSKIFVVPAAGGEARQVTPNGASYWHGWSPDGKTLVYCGVRTGKGDIYLIPTEGGAEKSLTQNAGHNDGPEYTADGSKIYFHSDRAGAPKIWRMNPDGSEQQQITSDEEYADWFAHPSPDGKWIVFLSYDKSVKGHPANQNVVLRLMPMGGGKPKVIATLFGGQGTLNVPSWSPDSTQIAFVSYRNVIAPTKKNKETEK